MLRRYARVVGPDLRCFMILLIGIVLLAPASAKSSEDKQLLSVPTRFGAMVVTDASHRGDDGEFTAVAHLGTQEAEIGSSTNEVFASLDGVFQVTEGDLVVVDIPSGVRGAPSAKVAILVTGPQHFTVVSNANFYTADDTFKVEPGPSELKFDVGWENRKRKTATYANGKITVANAATEPGAHLSRNDCAELLNRVRECRSFTSCSQAAIGESPPMSTQRWMNSLEEGPVFEFDNFLAACESTCRTRTYSPRRVRPSLRLLIVE